MTVFRCLLPIIITSGLSGLNFSLLESIQNKINVETDYCAFVYESYVHMCVISILVMTEIMISNDLAERRSI